MKALEAIIEAFSQSLFVDITLLIAQWVDMKAEKCPPIEPLGGLLYFLQRKSNGILTVNFRLYFPSQN